MQQTKINKFTSLGSTLALVIASLCATGLFNP